jgi:phosphatidylglycerophosphatase A
VAPGSCGSAVVAVIFLATVLGGGSPLVVGAVMLAVAVHGFVVTILFGDRAIARYGPDPRVVVSDERCGQAITYLWLWHFSGGKKEVLVFALAGFVLFRLFDVIKPPPARQLERVPGAWGVLLDDVMAGIYAHIVLQLLWRWPLLHTLWT